VKASVLKKVLIFWCLFIGIGAMFGGAAMLLFPSGEALSMEALLPYFRALPFADTLFQDFVFPGTALILVNGIPQLMTAASLLAKHRMGPRLGVVCGILLMLWILIQFIIFPFNLMSAAYFVFGAAEALTGILLHRKELRA